MYIRVSMLYVDEQPTTVNIHVSRSTLFEQNHEYTDVHY